MKQRLIYIWWELRRLFPIERGSLKTPNQKKVLNMFNRRFGRKNVRTPFSANFGPKCSVLPKNRLCDNFPRKIKNFTSAHKTNHAIIFRVFSAHDDLGLKSYEPKTFYFFPEGFPSAKKSRSQPNLWPHLVTSRWFFFSPLTWATEKKHAIISRAFWVHDDIR